LTTEIISNNLTVNRCYIWLWLFTHWRVKMWSIMYWRKIWIRINLLRLTLGRSHSKRCWCYNCFKHTVIIFFTINNLLKSSHYNRFCWIQKGIIFFLFLLLLWRCLRRFFKDLWGLKIFLIRWHSLSSLNRFLLTYWRCFFKVFYLWLFSLSLFILF
jgi:hypothetical protein